MSYGPSFDALYRGAAGQGGRISRVPSPVIYPSSCPRGTSSPTTRRGRKGTEPGMPQSVLDAATPAPAVRVTTAT